MPVVMPRKAAPVAATANKYAALLAKVQSLNLGGGKYWKPPVGRSVIRILPPIGTMGFFFKEAGVHYIGDNHFGCPRISTDGQLPCPICEVQDELWKSGEKDAAKQFNVNRSFNVNIIDRGKPDSGVQIYCPGVSIFQAWAALVSDPDYGDISDPEQGFDIKIDRTGEGKNDTRYQVQCMRQPSPLGLPDEIEKWLADATDLEADATKGLLSYDELMLKSGVNIYFNIEAEPVKEVVKPTPAAAAKSALAAKPAPKRVEPEPVEEEEEIEEEEEPVKATASSAIAARLAQRQQRAAALTTSRR